MSLAELRLQALRCLDQAELALHPRFNLITGVNGSGKTSLLEAVHLVGRGRSFRTRYTEQLVRRGASQLLVLGQIDGGHAVSLQCSRQDGLQACIDRRPVESLVELSELFPVQVIDPGIHRLVEEGPTPRRRWLDWAVFHVEPNFLSQWQGYQRALRQRNAALKIGADATLWDAALVQLGQALTSSRLRLLDALRDPWAVTLRELGAVETSLEFYPGWARDQTLADALASQLPRDRERGTTSSGAHRFDIPLKVDGRPAREVVSRGQQKLIGAAMTLAMTRLLAQAAARVPTLLLDDPAAELDSPHTEALLRTVAAIGGQLIVTALRPEHSPLGVPDRVFHVEHGGVQRL